MTDEGFKNFEGLCEHNKKSFKCCMADKETEVYGGVKGYLKATGSNSVLALIKDSLK